MNREMKSLPIYRLAVRTSGIKYNPVYCWVFKASQIGASCWKCGDCTCLPRKLMQSKEIWGVTRNAEEKRGKPTKEVEC